ncbi:hypothetical protein ACS4N0_08535 [Levilactobacillus zymae]|uniref:hypothetical protein n=1 Tax=Levilactobacillus zymae TaxID=267363 RepID=UPI003FCE983D
MHKFFKAGMLLGLSLSGIYAAAVSSTTARHSHVLVADNRLAVKQLRVHYGQDRIATAVTCYPARRSQRVTPIYRVPSDRNDADGWIWRGNLPTQRSVTTELD